MFVVGKTKPREIYVASIDREFCVDEYIIVKDKKHGNILGEIQETMAYSMESEELFKQFGIYEDLLKLDFVEKGNILFLAKVKILEELQTPVTPLSPIDIPSFSDVENLMIQAEADKGLVLGIIKGTESMYKKLDISKQKIVPLFDKRKGYEQQNGVPFILNHYLFKEYPHIAFLGGSGSGKTYAIRAFCEELMKHRIPGLVFDPHYEFSFSTQNKEIPEEYLMDFSNRYKIFQIGKDIGIHFPDLTTEELMNLLEFVGELTPPMRGAIEELHEKNDSFITLYERVNNLKIAFENYEKPKREQEVLPNHIVELFERHRKNVAGAPTLQAVSWRLDQLNKCGIFNNNVNGAMEEILKRKLVIIRGTTKLLMMLSSYLIRKLYTQRRNYKDWEQKGMNLNDVPAKFPPFFIVVDEAHIFAPDGKTNNPAKRLFREISQEARKYGVFEVFGTQRPSCLDQTILSQMNTKIIFRTGIASDMQTIQKETNLNDEQVARLPDLTTGNAFISSATLQKTFYIRFRATRTISPHEDNPFDELDMFDEEEKIKNALIDLLPIRTEDIPSIHREIAMKVGRTVQRSEITETLEELVRDDRVEKVESIMGDQYLKKN